MTDLLASTLMLNHPDDAAQALEPLDAAEIVAFFDELPERTLAKVLVHLTPAKQAECVKGLAEAKITALLPLLPASLCAQLLLQFDSHRRKKLVRGLPLSVAMALKVVQGYPEGTVGAVMDPFTPTLPLGIGVEEALKRLRTLTQAVPHQVFVTDNERRLVGRVSTSDLLLAARKSRLDDLIRHEGPVFADHAQLDELELHPAWINETLIPVVDRKGLFLGALSQSRLALALSDAGLSASTVEQGSSAEKNAVGNGFVDMADLLWSLLGALLDTSRKASKAKKSPSESSHEH